MSEWLDLMLKEIARKERDAKEAESERKRRDEDSKEPSKKPADQS